MKRIECLKKFLILNTQGLRKLKEKYRNVLELTNKINFYLFTSTYIIIVQHYLYANYHEILPTVVGKKVVEDMLIGFVILNS